MEKPYLTIVRTPENHLHFDGLYSLGEGEDDETGNSRVKRKTESLIDTVREEDPGFGCPFLALISFPPGDSVAAGYRIDEGYMGGGPRNEQPVTPEGLAELIDTIQKGDYVPEMGVIGPVKGVVEFIGPKDYDWGSSPLNGLYTLRIVDLS